MGVALQLILTCHSVYWLKNGYEKIQLNLSDRIPKGGGVVKLPNHSFIGNEKFIIQGYYQCVVFDPNYMKEEVRSEKLRLKFQGNIFVF